MCDENRWKRQSRSWQWSWRSWSEFPIFSRPYLFFPATLRGADSCLRSCTCVHVQSLLTSSRRCLDLGPVAVVHRKFRRIFRRQDHRESARYVSRCRVNEYARRTTIELNPSSWILYRGNDMDLRWITSSSWRAFQICFIHARSVLPSGVATARRGIAKIVRSRKVFPSEMSRRVCRVASEFRDNGGEALVERGKLHRGGRFSIIAAERWEWRLKMKEVSPELVQNRHYHLSRCESTHHDEFPNCEISRVRNITSLLTQVMFVLRTSESSSLE